MRHTIPLLLLFFLGLLFTACSGSPGASPTPLALKSGMRVLLVPATGAGTPSQADLDATRTLLSQRLRAFGLKQMSVDEVTSGNRPALQVAVPHFGGDERATLSILLQTGLVEFWNTGPAPLPIGSIFTPSQFAQDNPGDKAPFTGADLDSSKVSVAPDQVGQPAINFEMKGQARERFGFFTQQHIGDYLTVTLDRKVIESAVVQSTITGPAQITGNFTREYATAIASVFKYPSLPASLQISTESSF